MYIGQQFGSYRLVRLIGHGGFADVYLGEHIHLNTQAAVKVLTTQLVEEEIAQFRNEARLVMNMDHPHIVRVLDFGMQGPVPYLVMAYAPLGSLRRQYPRGCRLPLAQIISYVQQVASALQYIHDRKLIHRDVKPENMLVIREGTLALSDFGIAVVAHSERSFSQQKDIGGTGVYMAPEQFLGKPRTASDQYALGIVVYECLTGAPPFHGSIGQLAYQHAHVSPRSLREQIPLSPHVEGVILRALAKDPSARFPTVRDFALALEEASHAEKHIRSGAPLSSLPGGQASLATPQAQASLLLPGVPVSDHRRSPQKQARKEPDSSSSVVLQPPPAPSEPASHFSGGRIAYVPSSLPAFTAKKRWLVPLVLMVAMMLIIGSTAYGGAAMTHVVFPMPTTSTSDGPATTVTIFLNEVERQDYNRAYTLLDDSLLLVTTEMDFARQAQADDRCFGPLIHYARVVNSEHARQGREQVTYTLTRKKLTHTYSLSFTLQQDPGWSDWRIASYGTNDNLGPAPPTC